MLSSGVLARTPAGLPDLPLRSRARVGLLTALRSWTVGDNWPLDGEVDLLEGWNTNPYNKPALHMGDSATYGSCTLDGVGQTGTLATSNCDNRYSNPPFQYENQGCVVNDQAGPWASANGGTCTFYVFEFF